jgi:hypothetical protein
MPCHEQTQVWEVWKVLHKMKEINVVVGLQVPGVVQNLI